MIRDIFVYVPGDKCDGGIIDCAVSIAQMFNAHLAGFTCIGPMLVPTVPVGASSAALAVASQFEQGLEQAASALAQLQSRAGEAGISLGTKTICDSPYPPDDRLIALSRLYDLLVVGQPNRGDSLAEKILFQSGRPMLMVPQAHHGPLIADRVLLCWDGGRRASRALHDALPFLHKASRIDIVTISHSHRQDASPAAVLTEHLAHHGLQTAGHSCIASSASVHDAIVTFAAQNEAGLIIMGGYDHSKLQESVFGGVTHEMFRSMAIPVMMSH